MASALDIYIIHESDIVLEGIKNIISNTEQHHCISTLKTLQNFVNKKNINKAIIFIDPILILNIEQEWENFKEKNIVYSIALLSSQYQQNLLAYFDDYLSLHSSTANIQSLLYKAQSFFKQINTNNKDSDELTHREKEILYFLSQGKSIKEIADILKLSPHTILTHRKNISVKTGIKSIAGLTLYAISKGIVTIKD